MLFSERLEILIKEKNVTWKEVYTSCHIGRNQKRYWETKGIVPELETLLKLAEYFGVSVDYLNGTSELKEQALKTLDTQTLTLTAEEVGIILNYRNLDNEGRIMVKSTIIAETRRMAENKSEESNVG